MRMMAVAAMTLLAAGVAQAQGRPPQAVMARVAEMDAECRAAGGRTGDRTGLLQASDLNRDGQTDWVLNETVYRCDGAASLFSGSGGGAVWVYPALGGGRTGEPFYSGAFGASVEGGALWLTLGDAYCDGEPSCRRPVVWSPRDRAFALGSAASVAPVDDVPGRASPHRLVGRWTSEGEHCGGDSAQVFHADGRVSYGGVEGRWSVDGDIVRVDFEGEPAEDLMEWEGDDRVRLISQKDGYELMLVRCP